MDSKIKERVLIIIGIAIFALIIMDSIFGWGTKDAYFGVAKIWFVLVVVYLVTEKRRLENIIRSLKP